MPYASINSRRERDRIYREANKEKIKAYLKKWYAEHPDYEDQRFINSPERFLRNLHYGIWKRPGNHDLTLEHLCHLWQQQGGRCALTGVRMTHRRVSRYFDTNVSMDRIDNNKGYMLGNVRLVCRRINSMRSNMTDADFIFWCDAMVNGPAECRPEFFADDYYAGAFNKTN